MSQRFVLRLLIFLSCKSWHHLGAQNRHTEFGVVQLHRTRKRRFVVERLCRFEMEFVKNDSINFEVSSDTLTTRPHNTELVGRFQVIVEYAAGICIPSAVADSAEEAVKAFLAQAPACKEGEIALFDRGERRVVASAKWKIGGTEIGLPIPHRQNIFHDWQLALIAMDTLKQRAGELAEHIA